MTLGKKTPFKKGESVGIRIGPYKGMWGVVTGFSDGHPWQWVMVKTSFSESLMFDWHELNYYEGYVPPLGE